MLTNAGKDSAFHICFAAARFSRPPCERSDVSGLETAIRNALARSDRANAEVRARIYQSARNALEAGLRKQEINDPQTVAAQRHRLEATIHQIEAEERAAAAPPVEIARETRVEPVAEPRREPEAERAHRADPVVDAPQHSAETASSGGESDIGAIRPDQEDRFSAGRKPAPATAAEATSSEPADFRPERVAKARRRRSRFFSFLLVVATLVAGFGTAAWWIETSGLLDPLSDDELAAPGTVSGGAFSGEDPLKTALDTQSRFSSDWRPVFAPQDTARLSAGPRGRVESVATSEGPAARVTSSDPERDGAVQIPVSPEMLREMAGKTSTVALSLRSVSGKPVQISVECAFATMGGCGRHRFTVSERTDVLFQVEFDRSLSPSEPGHLIVNSDVAGDGASVDLYAVRILPGE